MYMYIDKGKTSAAHNAVKAMAAGEFSCLIPKTCMYMCGCIYMYIYIFIYMERER